MLASIGARVRHADTDRVGTVRVMLSLDWPEVVWDDAPDARPEMVHSSKLVPDPGSRVLHAYDGVENVPAGDANALQLVLAEDDVARYSAQRDRETRLADHVLGSWVEVTDRMSGQRYRVATAPCGLGCRCAAVAERIAKDADEPV